MSNKKDGKSSETNIANDNVFFSNKTCEWATPQWLFDALNEVFQFTLDPCSTGDNKKCERNFTKEDKGEGRSWEKEVVWMNPPYGKSIAAFMKKAHDAAENENATVVSLVPSNTGTAWFQDYALKAQTIVFLRGRLRFGNAKNCAPFDSALIVMQPEGEVPYSAGCLAKFIEEAKQSHSTKERLKRAEARKNKGRYLKAA